MAQVKGQTQLKVEKIRNGKVTVASSPDLISPTVAIHQKVPRGCERDKHTEKQTEKHDTTMRNGPLGDT